ncbi:MAG: UDP-3-O-[3-hydroxymyristoyl] N-acetylglucosamine deacetylase [Armatimonadetes bacterium]|nr:UDP-3-O-[3-hydroxymyristoyl] N-acetylglucosamine deacetylase [Armatimonadota bacterium]
MIFQPGEQKTLAAETRFEGIGIHTGAGCSVRVMPAESGTGIVFRQGTVAIRACPANVVDTSRGTTLGVNGARVVCVEHLLSALAGSGIDNAECEIEGPELPALDGSANEYVERFLEKGAVDQGAERTVYSIEDIDCVSRGQSVLVGSAGSEFELGYLLRYDHPLIGMSYGHFCGDTAEFRAEIAPARTFGLWSEAEELRSHGLALGASEDNALIVYDHEVRPELRYPDEFVRHKLLDMLGDLALTGGAISGTLFGVATGHWANVEMARRIRKE